MGGAVWDFLRSDVAGQDHAVRVPAPFGPGQSLRGEEHDRRPNKWLAQPGALWGSGDWTGIDSDSCRRVADIAAAGHRPAGRSRHTAPNCRTIRATHASIG